MKARGPANAVLSANYTSPKIQEESPDDVGRRAFTAPRYISPTRYKYKIIPEEAPSRDALRPLDFRTGEVLDGTPSILKSLSPVHSSGPDTFIYIAENEDPCQTFVIAGDEENFVERNNRKNADEPEPEFLSYVIDRSDTMTEPTKTVKCASEETKPTKSVKCASVEKPEDAVDCCRKHVVAECNGADVLDKELMERKEQAFARLQEELQSAHRELRLKDEEVVRLTRIREDMEKELEDLTASLFQEAHKMVREANERQAAAEKSLTESRMKVDVLTAEVAALKTLVLTSTPSRPNPHLHPQISKDESNTGVNLFTRKHRRSPSHFNLKYGRESSPPDSPVKEQRPTTAPSPAMGTTSVDSKDVMEVDPNVHKEFLTWKQSSKFDKTDPFIARIYREDINLCLNFNNTELAEQVRRAVESRDVYIEAVTDKTKTLFPKKCALLEVPRQCQYRMKLGDEDVWYTISQICRNRIIAVCEFLNYLRYIELGLVKSTAHDVYWEVTRLRKEMVLARLGLSLSNT